MLLNDTLWEMFAYKVLACVVQNKTIVAKDFYYRCTLSTYFQQQLLGYGRVQSRSHWWLLLSNILLQGQNSSFLRLPGSYVSIQIIMFLEFHKNTLIVFVTVNCYAGEAIHIQLSYSDHSCRAWNKIRVCLRVGWGTAWGRLFYDSCVTHHHVTNVCQTFLFQPGVHFLVGLTLPTDSPVILISDLPFD